MSSWMNSGRNYVTTERLVQQLFIRTLKSHNSINQSFNQSINQSSDQSTNQSFNQSVKWTLLGINSLPRFRFSCAGASTLGGPLNDGSSPAPLSDFISMELEVGLTRGVTNALDGAFSSPDGGGSAAFSSLSFDVLASTDDTEGASSCAGVVVDADTAREPRFVSAGTTVKSKKKIRFHIKKVKNWKIFKSIEQNESGRKTNAKKRGGSPLVNLAGITAVLMGGLTTGSLISAGVADLAFFFFAGVFAGVAGTGSADSSFTADLVADGLGVFKADFLPDFVTDFSSVSLLGFAVALCIQKNVSRLNQQYKYTFYTLHKTSPKNMPN